MKRNNPYYRNCKYLVEIQVDRGLKTYVKQICGLFGNNLNDKGIRVMCCINNSPYQDKNCKYFKNKNGQTTLFGDEL